ncbi:protein catecholamines up [Glossina fuscipes]|uniref:Protein catecholamines up n=1 Tax=Glossina fuscipes TaxID=7396 RepID=A0A9C5Z3P3_9MUSC|nr:protein catecholamines up [Glossina fuscipes]
MFCALFCILVLPSPTVCHNHESPSFKYSREANKLNEEVKILHQCNHKHTGSIDMNYVWLYSLVSTLLISAAPFLLLFLIPLDNSDSMKPRLKIFLAFTSGGLLGDAFLHLIPHAVHPHPHEHVHEHEQCNNEHSHEEPHGHNRDIIIGLWILIGIIIFLAVEKLVRFIKGTGHSHSHTSSVPKKVKDQKSLASGDHQASDFKISAPQDDTTDVEIAGYLNLAADFAHNFTDGLAIGASYLAGESIGIITTITILLHEVPHEIGDFAILIKSGCTRRRALMLQLVTALGALTGNILALIGIGASTESIPWILPFTAGGFIYIATVSVLPELLEESTKLVQSIKEIMALLIGVTLMYFIATFE